MFFYDQDGELQYTSDPEKKLREHITTMLRTSNFNLRPSAAGKLSEVLGETDPNMGRREAHRRVQNALEEAGMPQVSIDVAVEALDEEWAAKVGVGQST